MEYKYIIMKHWKNMNNEHENTESKIDRKQHKT